MGFLMSEKVILKILKQKWKVSGNVCVFSTFKLKKAK